MERPSPAISSPLRFASREGGGSSSGRGRGAAKFYRSVERKSARLKIARAFAESAAGIASPVELHQGRNVPMAPASSRGWDFSSRELDGAVATFQRGELLSKHQMAVLRAAADPLFFAKEFKRAPKLSTFNFGPPSKRNSVGWEAFTCADATGRMTMREHTKELPRVSAKGDILGAYRTPPQQKRSSGSIGAGGGGSGGSVKLRPSASGPSTRMGVAIPEQSADAACRKCISVQTWSSLGFWLRAAVRTHGREVCAASLWRSCASL